MKWIARFHNWVIGKEKYRGIRLLIAMIIVSCMVVPLGSLSAIIPPPWNIPFWMLFTAILLVTLHMIIDVIARWLD